MPLPGNKHVFLQPRLQSPEVAILTLDMNNNTSLKNISLPLSLSPYLYLYLSLIMNICSLCSRVREHVFAEHAFAHVCGEHMFAGGRFLKIIISWCFAQAFECFSS